MATFVKAVQQCETGPFHIFGGGVAKMCLSLLISMLSMQFFQYFVTYRPSLVSIIRFIKRITHRSMQIHVNSLNQNEFYSNFIKNHTSPANNIKECDQGPLLLNFLYYSIIKLNMTNQFMLINMYS